jgi:hypothetical protein
MSPLLHINSYLLQCTCDRLYIDSGDSAIDSLLTQNIGITHTQAHVLAYYLYVVYHFNTNYRISLPCQNAICLFNVVPNTLNHFISNLYT